MTPCPICDDTGWVCENHPNAPWGGMSGRPDACYCGGAGAPCSCNTDPLNDPRGRLDIVWRPPPAQAPATGSATTADAQRQPEPQHNTDRVEV